MAGPDFDLTSIHVTLPRVCEYCHASVVDEPLPDIVLMFYSPQEFYDEEHRDVEYICTRCQLSDQAGVYDALRAVYDAREDMFTTAMFEGLINDLHVSGALAEPRPWRDLQPIVWKWRYRIRFGVLFQQVELVLNTDWAVTYFRSVAEAAFKAVDHTMFGTNDPRSDDAALRQAVDGVRQSMIDSVHGPEGLESIFKYLEELLQAHGYDTQISPPEQVYVPRDADGEDGQPEAT
ncbi:uncharacterized protein F4812DRAFT_454230 [Daldinia caldariorum]|uniref:uncharacterized protein n=1 Tax=Daldinia caldariorum TaxID=326644 RepID=UPI0020073A8B|nr:uncharacterized protein F4812DRAFT_454230 [Daldinia caldariorum]KAI1472415.1 hypothetical protein F4812DRAFT_454230 [Daldinia caldariorum]